MPGPSISTFAATNTIDNQIFFKLVSFSLVCNSQTCYVLCIALVQYFSLETNCNSKLPSHLWMQTQDNAVIGASLACNIHAAGMPVISFKTESDQSDDSKSTDGVEDMTRKAMSISIDIEDAAAKERRQIDDMEFKLLCVDLRTLPGYAQFLMCCGGVFVFFLMYGYCQVGFCDLYTYIMNVKYCRLFICIFIS